VTRTSDGPEGFVASFDCRAKNDPEIEKVTFQMLFLGDRGGATAATLALPAEDRAMIVYEVRCRDFREIISLGERQ
jgi:hypothetical protein